MACRVLTAEIRYEGDTLDLYEHPSGKLAGSHAVCNYTFNIKSIGKYNVIFCPSCGLRIKFPSHIKKLEDLERFLVNDDDTKEKTPTRFDLMDMDE